MKSMGRLQRLRMRVNSIVDGVTGELNEGVGFYWCERDSEERFFKAWEGSETWSADGAGEAIGLPGCRRRRFVALIQLSLGRLLLSRACVCFTGQNRSVSRFRCL